MNNVLPVSLWGVNELAGGARLGGLFRGPTQGTKAIWKGRPPILDEQLAGPMTLAIAAEPPAADPGRTLTIHAEGGNQWGGKIRRTFSIGAGLSAELRMGNFQHVLVRTDTDIPEGMTLFFSWTYDVLGRSPLYHYLSYPVANVVTALPEGAAYLIPEFACNITWQLTTFGSTITQAVAAGERVPSQWGAFSCNRDNEFIVELRGL
jgi:hypothetical protein